MKLPSNMAALRLLYPEQPELPTAQTCPKICKFIFLLPRSALKALSQSSHYCNILYQGSMGFTLVIISVRKSPGGLLSLNFIYCFGLLKFFLKDQKCRLQAARLILSQHIFRVTTWLPDGEFNPRPLA